MHHVSGSYNAQYTNISYTYLLKLVRLVKIRHLTRGEDVIDILEERLFDHLCVSEQEHTGIVLNASLVVELLEILSELLQTVVAGDFDLEHFVVEDVGCQSTEALTTTPTNTDQ